VTEHPEPPSPGPGTTPRRRRTIVALAAVIILIGMVASVEHFTRDHPVRFTDKSFTAGARSICAGVKSRINDRQPPGDDATPEERAQSVERIAGILGQMVNELRGVPVASIDARNVGRWLDDLEAFVAVGPRYAAAIRSRDPRRTEEVGNEGAAPIHRFNDAARTNDLTGCVLG